MVRLNPPWEGLPISPKLPRISDNCYNLAFFTAMVYEEAVKLYDDLLNERLEQASRDIATLYDIIPQIPGLRLGASEEERRQIITVLGEVDSYLRQGDIVLASDAADRLTASVRYILFNTIVRCEKGRW